MKVGLISFHSFHQPGGVKKHILGLHKEFQKRGIEVKIIAPRRKRSEDYGKDVILLGTSFPLHFSGSQSDFDINFNPIAINKVLNEEKFDILHFHNFGSPSALQILERSSALNILTFHANIEGSTFLKSFPIFLVILNKVLKWKMDGLIGVAPLILRNFKDYRGPKTVIPNGIDLEEFNHGVPRLDKFNDGKINLLFIGRIEKRKGLIYLLRAYQILSKRFSNLRLIIVGDGELRKECQRWVKSRKLKEVYFEGEITGGILPSYYRTCDIFVSPAIFGESFGLVLLEAMASGKPVVAFANQGYKELFEGKKGEKFLVKPKDYKALTEKIEALIEKPQLRKEMGDWGLREVQKYSWDRVASQVLDFYQLARKNKLANPKSTKILPFDKIINKMYSSRILDRFKPK